MNPVAKARGLQLAWNDEAAAGDRMTSARQRRTPAASAPLGASVNHFRWATISAHNAGMFGWEGALQTVRSVRRAECLSTQAVKHTRRRRSPRGEGRGLRAAEGEYVKEGRAWRRYSWHF